MTMSMKKTVSGAITIAGMVASFAAQEFPMTLSFYCPTHGNSIVYTTEEGIAPHWMLYGGPLHLAKGNSKIRIKAVRYGYKDSEEVKGVFEIR